MSEMFSSLSVHHSSSPDLVADQGPAAVCRQVTKRYLAETASAPALEDVSLSILRGRMTVVIGPSGSGKSTLLRLLACVDSPDSGSIELGGTRVDDLRARGRRRLRQRQIAYLFQRPGENLLPYLDATAQVRLAAHLRGTRATSDEVTDLLARLGLAGRADHYPAQLSGGEQQRLAVACGVMGDPALVVADEPTAELDTAAADRVLAAMTDLTATGVSFVVSSHDPRVMAVADDFIRLDHGRLVQG